MKSLALILIVAAFGTMMLYTHDLQVKTQQLEARNNVLTMELSGCSRYASQSVAPSVTETFYVDPGVQVSRSGTWVYDQTFFVNVSPATVRENRDILNPFVSVPLVREQTAGEPQKTIENK
jgi:hypothetical protein